MTRKHKTRMDPVLRAREHLANEALGRRIRETRTSRNVTQYALADKCGCRTESIHRLERGMHMPSAALLDKIALALETSAGWLLRGDPS